MTQYPVVAYADVAAVPGESKHQLSSKAILHQVPDAETSLFRVKPGGRIKSHYHQKVWDLFIGITGVGEIVYIENGRECRTPFTVNSFCAMPPNVTHEVRNLGSDTDLEFILVHAPWEGYDHVPVRAPE
jgi:mannose-6-phosphate isomerase-like protein (cupin superfamily)